MIRILLASAAGAMALAGTALAADLPVAPPPVLPPPPPMWSGFYFGMNAGYEWAANRSINTTAIPGPCDPTIGACGAITPNYSVTSATAATFSAPLNPNSFIGGGQIGYNYQFFSSWVVGIEADIDGLAGHSNVSVLGGASNPNIPASPIVQTATLSKSLDYLGTVRGRFGYLLTPTLLIYGDGGLAFGGATSRTFITQTITNTGGFVPPYSSTGSFSNTRVGWSAGGGAEWMFLPNWSVKVEYLYYDLGNVTYSLSPLVATNIVGGIVSTAFPRATTRFNGNVVRAGINYHFGWPAPVVAKY